MVLKYFDNPEEWFKTSKITKPNYSLGGAISFFDVAFPELAKNKDFAKQIVSDLSARGLAGDWNSLHVMISSMLAPWITPLGRQFLAFISSPIKEA